MTPNLQSSFYNIMGMREGHRDLCLQAIQDLYPRYKVRELDQQGYCSITLSLIPREDTALHTIHHCLDIPHFYRRTSIVQIRPEQHALDEDIVTKARGRYGSLVPEVQRLDCNILLPVFQTYEMEMIPGTPFSQYQPRTTTLDDRTFNKLVSLIQSFASFVAKAWPSPPSSLTSPNSSNSINHCPGKVGSTILSRLAKLTQLLPDHSLRNKAAETLSKIQDLGPYPVVINHGDLIPSNILVDPTTWELQGLVDWAEAEYLPFGTHLYGLEHLLGYMSTEDPSAPRFCYYRQSRELREVFWDTLCKESPGVKERLEDVWLVRDLGVLLWYGFAWDEGRIDRVVNERDDEEVEYLRRFLEVRNVIVNCTVTEPP